MNNTAYPRFTVIIPQKDRSEYLIHTLRTCMIQDYPNFEIIVGDDCSEDNTIEVVQDLQKQDPRIKLIAHDHHVGMRDNFELTLDEVKPGYVMALGGDDGLVPGCIWKMYRIIKETGCELLTWSQAGYKYPMHDECNGLFVVPRKKFKGVKMVRSTEFLTRVAHKMNYMTEDCPMFYVKGVASTDLVNRVKSRTPDGRFYYCPTPDGFSGIVLAGEVKQYAYTREPLSITGDSPKSQGRNYKRTDEKSKKESQQFFNDNIRVTMHKDLASQQYSPLITLMTADYLLTAQDLPGWPGTFESFTWEHLIRKTFGMLEKNPFANEVLVRELRILREIAIQHEQLELFEDLLKNTRRKIRKEAQIDGFLLTKNVFEFNGDELGINNIFDASLAVKFAYEAYNQFSFRFFLQWIGRTCRVLINDRRYITSKLPQID